MTIDKKWFQDRIRDLGTSQRQIAAMVATNPNTMSLILNGKRKLTHDEVPVLASALQTSSDEVLRRLGVEGLATDSDTVPVLASVDETGTVRNRPAPRQTHAPAASTANTKAIVFESIQGGHQHGWVYFYEDAAKGRPVSADTLNALCVVEVGDSASRHLGIVTRSLDPGRYDLANPFTGQKIVTGVSIRNALPVTWIRTGQA